MDDLYTTAEENSQRRETTTLLCPELRCYLQTTNLLSASDPKDPLQPDCK